MLLLVNPQYDEIINDAGHMKSTHSRRKKWKCKTIFISEDVMSYLRKNKRIQRTTRFIIHISRHDISQIIAKRAQIGKIILIKKVWLQKLSVSIWLQDNEDSQFTAFHEVSNFFVLKTPGIATWKMRENLFRSSVKKNTKLWSICIDDTTFALFYGYLKPQTQSYRLSILQFAVIPRKALEQFVKRTPVGVTWVPWPHYRSLSHLIGHNHRWFSPTIGMKLGGIWDRPLALWRLFSATEANTTLTPAKSQRKRCQVSCMTCKKFLLTSWAERSNEKLEQHLVCWA